MKIIRIQFQNYENNEIHRIPLQNQENHDLFKYYTKFIKFHARIKKIIKI